MPWLSLPVSPWLRRAARAWPAWLRRAARAGLVWLAPWLWLRPAEPVRLVAFGVEPVGVIAVGANATGVVAIGQLATGVIAIGQLARGGIVVGQLAVGLVALGQLSVGVGYAAGMVGVGGTAGPGLIGGAFGRLFLLRLFGRQTGAPFERLRHFSCARIMVGLVVTIGLAILWWFAAGLWVMDALTRTGGVLIDRPHVLR